MASFTKNFSDNILPGSGVQGGTANYGPATATSGVVQETPPTVPINGAYFYSWWLHPTALSSQAVSVKTSHSGYPSYDRGCGPAVFDATGANGVFIPFCSAGYGNAEIWKVVGGTISTTAVTNAAGGVSPEVSEIRVSKVSGHNFYQAYKDNVAVSGFSWTDSSDVVNLGSTPRVGACFKHAYSFGDYYTGGIAQIAGSDIVSVTASPNNFFFGQ